MSIFIIGIDTRVIFSWNADIAIVEITPEAAKELAELRNPILNRVHRLLEKLQNRPALSCDRVEAGLNQRQLAELAGVRVETICRLEAGKHVPSIATVDKIDRAIKRHVASKRKSRSAK